MEAGRSLGRLIAWPFTFGYKLLVGDKDEGSKKTAADLKRPRSLRPYNREGSPTEWVLSPTVSPSSATWRHSSHDDLPSIFPASYGPTDDLLGDFSPIPNTNVLPHSVLHVPIPIEEETFQAYLAGMPDTAFPRYRLVLPKRPKILVLDLDETLVHSTSTGGAESDFLVEVLVEHLSCLYYVHKRPFVDHFIDVVSNWYQLAIYTASLREYADPVVNMLDKGRRLFNKRLFRTACIEKDGMYLKDLSLIESDLSQVFLLDNSAISFILNPENGIFIDSWLEDKKDTGLLDMLPFLDALRFVEDVRSVLSLRVYS